MYTSRYCKEYYKICVQKNVIRYFYTYSIIIPYKNIYIYKIISKSLLELHNKYNEIWYNVI